jgi:hypothetical protein
VVEGSCGLATLLTDGLIHLDDQRAVDLETERLVRAVLTGLAQETPPSTAWPTVRWATVFKVCCPCTPVTSEISVQAPHSLVVSGVWMPAHHRLEVRAVLGAILAIDAARV